MITLQKIFGYSILLAGLIMTLGINVFAAPAVTGVSGTITNSSTITITGSGFGASGPNIVLFDDFEGGTNGSTIKSGAGSATIGSWSSIGGGNNQCLPFYDNLYTVSGNLAYAADQTCSTDTPAGTDSSVSAKVTGMSVSDVYYSFWIYLPTTSTFPCTGGSTSCNWKLAWIYNTTPSTSYCCDYWTPVGNPTNQPSTINAWNIYGNSNTGAGGWFYNWTMNHGKWYRLDFFTHSTTDSSGYLELNFLGKDENIPRTLAWKYSGQLWKAGGGPYTTFSFNSYGRTCSAPCTESKPRFDDVYLATGSNARARVEIGNAPSYNTSTNLTLATVNSWSDTSIQATVRQGSFANFNNAYLFVIDASGNVSPGLPLCATCPAPPAITSIK